MKIERALLSVYNKDGLIEFAKGLEDLGIELIATGGTARMLKDAGLKYTTVEDVTQFPELMSGRVKTLHPNIMAGILARRSMDLEEIASHDIRPIDLVAVNLYPFEKVAFSGSPEILGVLEQIDIGGVTLLRAAAKNYPDVAVVASPERYGEVLDRLREGEGELKGGYLAELAREAFHTTAIYDSLIGRYFEEITGSGEEIQSSGHFNPIFRRVSSLRYGENPHQAASFFEDPFADDLSISRATQLHGKELSYNNIMDLDSAVGLVVELPEVACAIIKHSNPCGVGIGSVPLESYQKALATDPVSAFGSIITFNAGVDKDTAGEMKSLFVECIVAPSFSGEALEVLKEKKNLRILELPGLSAGKPAGKGYHLRGVRGGILVQEKDRLTWDGNKLSQVTKRKVTEEEKGALHLAWVVCKHIKSNGIVLSRADRTVAIGTGQMSRIDSVEICMMKAANAGLSVKGAVLASDAFFPFRDGIDRVAKEGITAVVQPGGSIRDEEVIKATDEHGIAMLFTGIRHFRH